jgi:hypothetical protein
MLVSELMENIGIGILIGSAFYFFAFSFFVYLNGREIEDYYLILFGKLKLQDVILAFITICLFTIYFTFSRYDSMLINIENTEWKIKNVDTIQMNKLKKPFTPSLTLNINLKDTKTSDVKIEETKHFPNFRDKKK